jgi:hypothetical protein
MTPGQDDRELPGDHARITGAMIFIAFISLLIGASA